MVTKKDYDKAAKIVRAYCVNSCSSEQLEDARWMRMGFIELFSNDNPKFDCARFDAACMPKTDINLAREVAASLSYKKR